MSSGGSAARPGWYPDPWRAAPLRWWDGAAWTGTVSAPPPRNAVVLDLAKEAQAGGQARWGVLLLGASQLLSVLVLGAMARGVVEMVRFTSAHPTSDEVPDGFAQVSAASLASAALSPLSLIGLVMLLIWFHRAVSNGIALGRRAPREPAMSVASWFIPVVNLWWPYESLRESVDSSEIATRRLIRRWWIAYLSTAFGPLVAAPILATGSPVALVLLAAAIALVAVEISLTRRVIHAVRTSHGA